MARTSSAEVEKIIEVEAAIDLTPFIAIANELVTECCVGKGYADARLILIESWLAAHFYSVRDPRAASETAGGVGAHYQSAVSLGFDTSHYGQTAMRLDTAGGLAALNTQSKEGISKSIGLTWLGTETDSKDEE